MEILDPRKFPICSPNNVFQEEKLQRCHKCTKTFPTAQQLLQHSLVHSNVRKFLCSFCDKSFKQLSHLQQHQRIHTGERPYCCVINGCTKAFRQLSSLQQHLKGHGLNRKNKCELLRNDKKSEASFIPKPYDLICQICDIKCNNSQSFFEHMYKYHPNYWRVFSEDLPVTRLSSSYTSSPRKDNLYLCSICNKRYIHRTGYIKHISNHAIMRADTCSSLPVNDSECQACEQVYAEDFYLIQHLHVKTDACHKVYEHSDNFHQYKNNRKSQMKSCVRQQPSYNVSDNASLDKMSSLMDKTQKLDFQFAKEQEDRNYISYSQFPSSFQVQYSRSLDAMNQDKYFSPHFSIREQTFTKNQIKEIQSSFENPLVFENGFGESRLNCNDTSRFIHDTFDTNQLSFPVAESLNSILNGSLQVASTDMYPCYPKNPQDDLPSTLQHFSKCASFK